MALYHTNMYKYHDYVIVIALIIIVFVGGVGIAYMIDPARQVSSSVAVGANDREHMFEMESSATLIEKDRRGHYMDAFLHSREHEQKDNPTAPALSADEAFVIAQASECAINADVQEGYFHYNMTARIWQFDMEMREKSPCTVVCVVDEQTLAAKLSERCISQLPE